ncbi:hypothetical protein BH09ACT6_BH09ACT6_24780 [soil metagenome]
MVERALLHCAECREPCRGDELVCPRCSERRNRSVDDDDAQSFVRRSPSALGLDAALDALERRSGERARSIDVDVNAILGGPGRVILRVVLAPKGVATPAEEVWTEPEILCDDTELGPDDRAFRLGWVERITIERGLARGRFVERYRLGLRDAAVSRETMPLLLAARLKSATLFLEAFTVQRVFVEQRDRTTCCIALFVHVLGRELDVELVGLQDPAPEDVSTLERFARAHEV